MSFSGEDTEVLYILVYIKLHIGNDMDSGHYVCDLLDYNTGTWWNCCDDTITKYEVYPNNVYDNLSIDNEQKKRKDCILDGSDSIVSIYILKKIFLHPAPTLFVQLNQYTKRWNTSRRNKIICNNIHTSIHLWKEDMETVIEKKQKKVQVKKTILIGTAMMGSKQLSQ